VGKSLVCGHFFPPVFPRFCLRFRRRTSRLTPWRIDIPERVRQEWPEPLQARLDVALSKLDSVEKHYDRPTKGSGDPYALIAKRVIETYPTLEAWLAECGGLSGFSMSERIGWEGQADAHRQWQHILRHEWRSHAQ